MKIQTPLLLLLAIVLAACAPAPISISTSTPTATLPPTLTPTATAMATATITSTPTVIPTATPVPLPAFMDEFVRLGYDQQSLDQGTIYVVFDTTSTAYPTDMNGLIYKGVVINSWTAVYYIDNGILVKAHVLNYACSKSKSDWNGYICIGLLGNQASSNPFPPTYKWAKGIFTQLYALLTDAHPIVPLTLDPAKSNAPEILESLYPAYTGKIEFVTVPGIGKVIAAQYLDFGDVLRK